MKTIKITLFFMFLSYGYMGLCEPSPAQALKLDSPQEVAEDILLMDPNLSLKYQRGAYLIYDCLDKHWVCTGEPEFNNCIDGREVAQNEGYERMPCVPVVEFTKHDECKKIQTRLTNSANFMRECLSETLKSINR